MQGAAASNTVQPNLKAAEEGKWKTSSRFPRNHCRLRKEQGTTQSWSKERAKPSAFSLSTRIASPGLGSHVLIAPPPLPSSPGQLPTPWLPTPIPKGKKAQSRGEKTLPSQLGGFAGWNAVEANPLPPPNESPLLSLSSSSNSGSGNNAAAPG